MTAGKTRPASEPGPTAETRVYGGVRVSGDGKKWHAWIDAAGDEHWFARTTGRPAGAGGRSRSVRVSVKEQCTFGVSHRLRPQAGQESARRSRLP